MVGGATLACCKTARPGSGFFCWMSEPYQSVSNQVRVNLLEAGWIEPVEQSPDRYRISFAGRQAVRETKSDV